MSLSAGERVPADLRLIEAQDLFVSQALLTGESNVLEKNTNRLASATQIPLDRFSNIAFMGSSVISGEGKGIVLAVGGSTVYGGYLSELQRNKHSFDTGANSIAWVLIRFMVALVPVVFVVSGITKGDWLTSFLFSLSVAVGLTPELLPMVINACLAKGSSAMGEKQTIVKNINAMQSFGSMDVLCVDKTGTLTGDEVILEYYLDILGEESREVLDCAYLNSFYHTGVANHLDQAILKCSSMPGRENHFFSLGETIQKLDELPFDYERKCVSVLLSVPEKENYIITKGDVDSVYSRCQYVQHKGQTLKIDTADSGGIHAIVDEMTEDGMKVLAVAYKPVSSQSRLQMEDEAELILLGYVVFFDAPKSSAASALQKLEQLHVQVKVLTGDQKSVTLSICRRLGIETEHILTGEEMEELSEDEQLLAVEKTTVFSQLSPGQKSQIIRMLRENGHAVGFLGDGMNDLAAMTAADVGISVDTATQAAKESADVILLKKDLNVLEQGILEGRKAFANMLKYIRITASSNFGNIFSIVLASAFLPFLPMTALQLLLLNLLYDILCMTLPWDRVDADVYEKPSEWSGKTLGRFMRFFGPLSSLFDLATFAFLYFILCPALLGDNFTELSSAMQSQFAILFHTGWFLESMWTQVLILHLLRTKQLSILRSRASGVVWLVTSAGLLILTAIVYTPAAHLLGLAPLPLWYFGFLAVTILAYMLLVTAANGGIFRNTIHCCRGGDLMKRVNFVSLDFLTLQWFCNTLQTQHPQTQAAKELYDALEALYAGKSDSLMLELGEAIPEAASTSLVCGNLLIDSKSRRVIRDGAEIQLTPKEFDILYFLARNRGEVFTKEQIYQAVWAEEYYTADSNIMAFIRKLRKKIEPNPDAPEYILTIWGIGYKFNDKLRQSEI